MGDKKLLRVAIYVRVSSQEQALHGYSIEEQDRKLSAYCDVKEWIIYDKYIDPGYSGSNINRPTIKKLISDAQAHKFDLVLVYKLDRLSRSQKDTMYLLEDVFLTNDIDLVAINESFDTSTPFGRAMIGILSVFAQLERENIKERTSMGRRARIRDGHNHGSQAPLGYSFIPGGNDLRIEPYEALIVKDIFKESLAGTPTAGIATLMEQKYGTTLRYWNNTTIRRILHNPVYIGKVSYGNELFDGIHEPIIDEDTFNQVQISLQRKKDLYFRKRQTNAENGNSIHLLTNLLYCGDCGARMAYNWVSPRIQRYSCYSVSRKSKRMIKSDHCTNRLNPFTDKELEEIVINEIQKLALDPEYLIETINTATPEDPNIGLRKRLDDISRQTSKLLELYKLGFTDIEEISKELGALNDEREKIEKLIDEQSITTTITSNEVYTCLDSFEETVEHGTPDDLYNIIHDLIDRIEIFNDDVKIFWSFC